jgi:hypothetical protein
MSSDSSAGQSDSVSGPGRLIHALDVPRLALIGFSVAGVVSVATFFVFIVLPGADQSPLLYFGLGFVLALSLGLLFTIILVAASAYRLVRQTDMAEPVTAEDLEDD